ncbi:kinase [Thraustotheca clavata]|uniref:Kinase n=1 Tax=Thraustotheca clavata TaxID=74557 RepID=A0A1V9ZUZ3_9STRA|nr:kinase [Thraustotheca clavata]
MSNPWLESSDLVAKFKALKAENKSIDASLLPSTAPISTVTDRLMKYNLTWEELGSIEKQAILWDMGIVTYSNNDPSSITQVYTKCNNNGTAGRQMTTVAMSRADFLSSQIDTTNQTCTSSVADPGDKVTYFRQEAVDGEKLRPYTNCAIHNISIMDSHSSMWSQDGQGLSSVPFAIVQRHAWNDGKYWEIFSIHTDLPETEAAWGKCAPATAPSGITIPCRVFSGKVEKDFCLPSLSPTMDKWLVELSAAKTAKNNTSNMPQVVSTTASSHTGTIVGVTLGVVALLLVIAFFVFRRFRTRHNKDDLNTLTMTNASSAMIDFAPITKNAINGDFLTLHQLIGSGAFAEVWRGDFQEKPVAVKVLLGNRTTNKGVRDFINEIALMLTYCQSTKISYAHIHYRFESPHIISVVGATWTRPTDLKLVMEYMDMGDLKDYLCNHSNATFPWNDKLVILRSIVEGLAYLHSIPVIHRDLKSRNVLLDSTKGAKLADFGIAKEDNHETMTVGVGTFRWMAPEVLQDSYYSVAADIYSLGMIVSEMDSHKIPFEDVKNPKTGKSLVDTAIIGAVLNGSLRPEFTPSCPPFIRELAEKCLVHDPHQRPTAFEISAMLKKTQVN